MNEPWLNITDLARETGNPETVTSQYVEKFASLLPSNKVGKITLYSPICVPILKRIAQLIEQGYAEKEVQEILNNEFQIESINIKPIDANIQAESSSKNMEIFTAQVTQFMRIVADQKQELSTLRQDFTNLWQELNQERHKRESLQAENNTLKKAMRFIWKEYKEEKKKKEEQGEEIPSNLQERLDAMSEMVRYVKKDHKELEKFLLQKIQKTQKGDSDPEK